MIRRPSNEPKRLKVSQLEEDVIYWLCPDKKCDIFFDDKYNYAPCRYHCPKLDDLVTYVKCAVCKDAVKLPGTYTPWQRVDHKCDKYKNDTCVASTFITGDKYSLIYETPLKD
ncbi:MAG: hypothetical protein ACP5N1_03775 [Candidatus Woesearchaeota archaeon]